LVLDWEFAVYDYLMSKGVREWSGVGGWFCL
jgi:hypothetical protein